MCRKRVTSTFALYSVLLLSISSLTVSTFGGGGATNSIKSDTEYYEVNFKTSQLGNYQIEVEAHEEPSNETLPIISNDYFPYTIAQYTTEVDNTKPTATYHTKSVAKVDVVFALGELSQQNTLQNYIPTFTSLLQSASNNIDAYVEQVKTSTISTSDKDSAKIFNEWFDGLSNSQPSPYWKLIGTKLSIQYGDELWDRFCDISTGGYSFGDGSISFYTQANVDGVHEHQYGVGFRLSDPQMSSGYTFSIGRVNGTQGAVAIWQLTGNSLPLSITDNTGGNRLAISSSYPIETLKNAKYTIKCSGTNIKVFINNTQVINVNHNGRTTGTYGIWARHSENGIWFDNFTITTGSTKSLGEAITDVSWRDGSTRFVIFATDAVPAECLPGKENEFAYTITKILNSNAYLIGLGTPVSQSSLLELINSIQQADGTVKGTYYNNSPIIYAMDSASNYIINIAKGLSKPTNWVLVNEQILWETNYDDMEQDLPLNFGKNKDDIKIVNSWGVSLTDYYTEDEILAEKWRYRHSPTFFDNATAVEPWSDIWLEQPVEIFQNPGKFRINYKRRDNPFYSNTLTTSAFDIYRYFSTDYDKKTSLD